MKEMDYSFGELLTNKVKRVALNREACKECPLRTYTLVACQTQYVDKTKDCDIVFIGINPGNEEAKQGVPFCGPSGKLLRCMIQETKLDEFNLAFTNAILCSTPDERKLQILSGGDLNYIRRKCMGLTNGISKRLNPKIYVPVGRSSSKLLFDFNGSIIKESGKLFEYRKKIVIPIIHPSAILRSGKNAAMVKSFKNSLINIYRFMQSNKE